MSPDESRTRIVLAFTCIFVVWGTTYLAIAVLLRSLPPFASAAMRFALAAAALFAWLRWRGPRPLAGLPTRTVIASGVLMCGFGNGFTVYSIQGVPSGMAALLNATIPISIALLDWGFFQRRRPAAWVLAGLFVAIAGVALVVQQNLSLAGVQSIGYVAALGLAVTAWSVGTLLQRGAVTADRLLALGCGQMAAGAGFLAVAAVVNGELARIEPGAVTLGGWLALLYLAAFGSVLSQSSYLWLLARFPAEKVTVYAVANPVVALLLGALVLGEQLTPASLLGAVLVLAGVSLVLFERRVISVPAAMLRRVRLSGAAGGGGPRNP